MKPCGVSRSSVFRSPVLAAGLLFGTVATDGLALTNPDEVKSALRRAATYFAEEVAVEGGYVYFYSPDLTRRLGEGVALPTEIWVQPPGTPKVGMAFLEAYDATGDEYYRDCALAAGRALVYGQLKSGGWRNSIDFDSSGPRIDEYRSGKGKGKNFSSLDDNISQAALRFLIRLDAACAFENKEVGEAARYALERVIQAQFANGAFPQGWNGPARPVETIPASYPDYEWRTEGRIKNYWDQYTLNDGMAGAMTDTLIAAHEAYGRPEPLESLKKLGDFLILSQMPEPQRGWAQQYGESMHPIWARAFEPPGISGRESEDVMIALLKIAEHTGDKRYLEPVVPGVKYLESSLLPDGQIARYYELETNRPLYMERSGDKYSLTYDDSNLPSHYGWKSEPVLDTIKAAYRALSAGRPVREVLDPPVTDPDRVEQIVKSLDDKGRWLSRYDGERLVGQAKFQPGEEYLSSEVFSENVRTMSRWLASARRR